MSTVKEHLTKTHLRSGEHFAKRATYHKAMSGHFRKLAGLSKNQDMQEGDPDNPLQIYGDIADEQDQQADESIDLAEFHKNCAKALMQSAKAAGMSDSDRLIPDAVSSILPERGTAVPRYGAPPLGDRTAVDPTFEKLLRVEE